MNKIVFDAKIQNLYSPDYEYLQDSIDTEIKKVFRQNIQNPFINAIIKGFNLRASISDPSKILIYHGDSYGGVITSTGEIVETSDSVDLVAASDITPGVVNYVYIRVYQVYGTFNKKSKTVEEGVQKNIDLYSYTKTYDRLVLKWEIHVYTQSEYLALDSSLKSQLIGLGSFVANGTSPITSISEAGRIYTRSFIQQGSIKTAMISSTGFIITQHNVSTSEQVDDYYAGTPYYLQDDLNKVRTIIREVKGTTYYDDYIDNSLLTSDASANKLHGNGVLPEEWNELQVVSNSTGLAVVVLPGKAVVRGGVSHVLQGAPILLPLAPQSNHQIGDWATRTGEEHYVSHKPTSFSLNFKNVGNLKITDIYNEPYPEGFDEGIDYTVDYENGIVYIPVVGSRIAEETVKCYYQWGYTRYDIVEIGERNVVQIKTGVAKPNPQPPAPDTSFLLLYQIKVDPFNLTIPTENLIDTRVYSQYVRNLYEINAPAISEYDFTINKVTYLTSSGVYDSGQTQWALTTYKDESIAITSTGGTRILTAVSCLPNDELWLLVDKTPWVNNITVELNPVAGYQEFGLNVLSSAASGLYTNSDYYLKINSTEYKFKTATNVTYGAIPALIQSAFSIYVYAVNFITNDIRVTDNYYIGLDSTISLDHCNIYSGDLFNNLTGFTAFDTSTGDYQEVGLDINPADVSGLSANTSYYFKVNATEYKIQTSTGLTYTNIAALMNTAVAVDSMTATIVFNTSFGETQSDIRVTNPASTVSLEFSNGDLFNHLADFVALDSSVDGTNAVDSYYNLDLSYKDRVEKFPIFIEDELSEGFHNVRLTVTSTGETFIFYNFLSGRADIYYDNDFIYSAPETEPYKVVNYRGVYSKFYVDIANSKKAQIYLDNKEICSSTGFYQDYWNIEQSYPVSRADNQNIVTGGTKDITDFTPVLSEDDVSTIMIYFTPTVGLLASENHQRVGIYLSVLGTHPTLDPWTYLSIRIHDSSNNQIGSTSTKNYADCILGWNYFELQTTLVPGQTYHYHVLVHGRIGSSPYIRTATGDATNRCYVEMYKPYTGMYKDSDVVNIITLAGASIVAVRSSGADSENARHDQSILDIMGVDLSDDTIWDSWSYETYIGVDVKTGRVKFPTGYDANNYWLEFNAKQRTSDFDAKTILRHGETGSVEDTFRSLTQEAYTTTIQGDGTFSAGGLVRINSSTGLASLVTNYSQFLSFIGICHRIPTVNKLGHTNPADIAVKGVTTLAATTSGFLVGDELYLTSGGITTDASTLYVGQAKRIGVVMQIVDSTHAKIFV